MLSTGSHLPNYAARCKMGKRHRLPPCGTTWPSWCRAGQFEKQTDRRFGDIGRAEMRRLSVLEALALLEELAGASH
jgi:nicotinamide mononucleotide (NMN) deamidase PncC